MMPAANIGDKVRFRRSGSTCYGQVLAIGRGTFEVVELIGSGKPGRVSRVRPADILDGALA